MSAARRTCRGDSSEAAKKTASEGMRNITCLLTKWKVGRPRRSATGGLAAIVRTRPKMTSVPSAASSQRSMVHHQFARVERSTRETMIYPP